MANNSHQELKLSKFEISWTIKIILAAAFLIGLATFIFGFVKNPERMWPAYLTSFFFFASIASSAMFFVAFNYAANAGWSVSIRRFSEALTGFFPYMLGAALVLIAGFKYLYAWGNPETLHALGGGKPIYLAPGFVIARLIIFGLGSILFAKKIVGNSVKQDTSGDHQLTKSNAAFSVGYILFFAISFSLFSLDLLMSFFQLGIQPSLEFIALPAAYRLCLRLLQL